MDRVLFSHGGSEYFLKDAFGKSQNRGPAINSLQSKFCRFCCILVAADKRKEKRRPDDWHLSYLDGQRPKREGEGWEGVAGMLDVTAVAGKRKKF